MHRTIAYSAQAQCRAVKRVKSNKRGTGWSRKSTVNFLCLNSGQWAGRPNRSTFYIGVNGSLEADRAPPLPRHPSFRGPDIIKREICDIVLYLSTQTVLSVVNSLRTRNRRSFALRYHLNFLLVSANVSPFAA